MKIVITLTASPSPPFKNVNVIAMVYRVLWDDQKVQVLYMAVYAVELIS